jgi:hypothetical protein
LQSEEKEIPARKLLPKKNLVRLLDQRFTSRKALEKPDHTPCPLVRLGEQLSQIFPVGSIHGVRRAVLVFAWRLLKVVNLQIATLLRPDQNAADLQAPPWKRCKSLDNQMPQPENYRFSEEHLPAIGRIFPTIKGH